MAWHKKRDETDPACDVVAMQLSDIHAGHHRGRKYLEKIVEEANRRKPDIVLITGDLIDSEAAFLPRELEPLARFSAPVYYVGGNREKYVDAERAFALVKQYRGERPPQPGGRNPRTSARGPRLHERR